MQTKKPRYFSSYGKALKTYIRSEGIKQSHIAEKTDIGEDQISNYVNDRRMPNESTQQKLVDFLGIEIKEVRPNEWILRSVNDESVNRARESVDRVEQAVNDYKASGTLQDDPQKLLELAEVLIRTAREAMKK